jgi:hypothetical protein
MDGIMPETGEVMERLPAHVDSLYLVSPSLAREEILHAIGDELGLALSGKRTAAAMRELQEHLIGRYGEGRYSYGHTLICDPWGHIIAKAPDKVGYIAARLDLEEVDRDEAPRDPEIASILSEQANLYTWLDDYARAEAVARESVEIYESVDVRHPDRVKADFVFAETLEQAEGFDPENWPDMADREWGRRIYRYYGLTPYWEQRFDKR